MNIERMFEEGREKGYVEKNLEAIKIIGGEVVDIINGQGCLIKPGTTILFGPDGRGNVVKIKDFERPYKVTSHSYLYCAEVIGIFSGGGKFYIHAQDPFEFKRIISSIVEEAKKEVAEDNFQITEIRIKSDFGRYGEDGDAVEGKKRDFERQLRGFNIDPDDISIRDESFVGFTPERVVGYGTEEGREGPFKNTNNLPLY